MLKYYQWSPFILLFMALCFYFPRMLWRSLNNKSGLDIEKLVGEALKQEQSDQAEERKKAVDYITNSIRVYIENRYRSSISNIVIEQEVFPQKILVLFNLLASSSFKCFYCLYYLHLLNYLFLINSLVQIFLIKCFFG